MNSTILNIGIFSGIVSLIGTILGCLIGISLKNPSNKFLGTILSVATGIIISIIFLELIPEALYNIGFIRTLIVTVLGMIVIGFLELIMRKSNGTSNNHRKVAFLMALGIMLHNFPEGIIMGFGFVKETQLGIGMSVLISIHDIPEGIAMVAPLIAAGEKWYRMLWYGFLVALPTAIGAWIGIALNTISPLFLGYSIAFASGVMLYVAFGQMLPESNELYSDSKNSFWILVGIIFGFVMIHLL